MSKKAQKSIFVVNGKWQAIRVHGVGGNCKVYEARHEQNNTLAALKSERLSSYTLEYENFIFDVLDEAGNPKGFPRRLFYGIHHGRRSRRVLVMDMLGDSFSDVMGSRRKHQKLNLKTVLRFGKQALRRLETLHGLGYVHCDVKPDNFCVGRKGSGHERTVHLIDFGNVQSFMMEENGQRHHIKFEKGTLGQTLLYGSEMATRGYTAGRKDDLESLMYVMVDMATGHLPWEKYHDLDNQTHIEQSRKLKAKKSIRRSLFKTLPVQVEEAYRYVRSLQFSEEPRYGHIYQMFEIALGQVHGHREDRGLDIPLD